MNQKTIDNHSVSDVLNTSELGQYLGWHRAKVNTYKSRAEKGKLKRVSFPIPSLYISGKPFWNKNAIDYWILTNMSRLGENALYFYYHDDKG